MKDFLGQTIDENCFLATGGAGNTKAEYGMVLYRVTHITDKGVKAHRLHCYYQDGKPVAYLKVGRLTNLNKYVVVEPPLAVLDFFDRFENEVATPKDMKFAATWLHGKTLMKWDRV